jgi:CRP-like cAMP-binding protein
MRDLEHILAGHRFFANFPDKYSALITGCAKNHVFEAGHYVIRESDHAAEFYLIRHGRMALEISSPPRPPIVFETLGEGDVVGSSWLVPPYRWVFDVRAVEQTRAIGIDAECLRNKCEADHDLGYEMMKLFMPLLVSRLNATRLQILDVYGRR